MALSRLTFQKTRLVALSRLALSKDQTSGSKPYGTSLMPDFELYAVCHILNAKLQDLSRLALLKDQTSASKPFDTFKRLDLWL